MNFFPKPKLGQPLNFGHPIAKKLLVYHVCNEQGGNLFYNYATGKRSVGNNTSWNHGGVDIDTDVANPYIQEPTYNIGQIEGSEGSFFCRMKSLAAPVSEYSGFFGSDDDYQDLSFFKNTTASYMRTYVGGAGDDFTNATVSLIWSQVPVHIVLTWKSSGDRKLYIDGVLNETISTAYTPNADANNLVFGIPESDNPLNATVYEYGFVNKALLDYEIDELYSDPYSMFRRTKFWMFDYTEVGGANAPTGVLSGPFGGCLEGPIQ